MKIETVVFVFHGTESLSSDRISLILTTTHRQLDNSSALEGCEIRRGGEMRFLLVGVPGERHQRCAHGFSWDDLLRWGEEFSLHL